MYEVLACPLKHASAARMKIEFGIFAGAAMYLAIAVAAKGDAEVRGCSDAVDIYAPIFARAEFEHQHREPYEVEQGDTGFGEGFVLKNGERLERRTGYF